MDNEKILEAARKDKNRGKEYENKETIRSSLIGAFVSVIIGLIVFFVEYFVKGNVNIGVIIVMTTAACIQHFYEGIKIKKAYSIVKGVVYICIDIVAILLFVWQVIFT